MTTKPPFDTSEMMKMFDPETVAKMFDPSQIMSAFSVQKPAGFDLGAVVESNKRNFEAMQAANKAAAAAYQDFYAKQFAIFEEITKGANEQVQSLASASIPDLASKQAEIYRSAMEKSLNIMTELAETSRRANEEAFGIVKDRVDEAIKELKQL